MPKQSSSKTKEELNSKNTSVDKILNLSGDVSPIKPRRRRTTNSKSKKEKKEKREQQDLSGTLSPKTCSTVTDFSEQSEQTHDTEILDIRQKLLIAILSKDTESIPGLLKELQNKKSPINFKDGKDHSTLLHRCAIQGGCIEVIKILIEHNAKIDCTDILGRTPLHICARKGDLDTFNFLINAGANVNAKTKTTQTPLHEASNAGHLNCIESLIKNHALINLKDNLGYTALHIAVTKSHINCVEYLIEKQADVLSLSGEGCRPIDYVEKTLNSSVKHPTYTSSGKTIYRLLKKAGGNKEPTFSNHLATHSKFSLLSRSNRKSYDHTKSNKAGAPRQKIIANMNSTIGVTNGVALKNISSNLGISGPIKFERKEEIINLEQENEEKDESIENNNEKQSSSVDLSQYGKIDRRGFYYDEENPPPPEIEVKSRQRKRTIIKEDKRAIKWVSIIQNEPVIKDMESFRKNKKILKLCDKGIPDAVRGQVWRYIAGVHDRDNNIYYKLLKDANWVPEIRDQIYRDINRTMPRHILFQEKGQG